MSDDHPRWGYRGPEAQIFHGPIPEGWSDRPARGFHPHDVEQGIQPEPEPAASPKPKAKKG